MLCRELSSINREQCLKLLKDTKQCAARSYVEPDPLELANYYFDDDEPLYKVYGVFDQDILGLCAFVKFSENHRSYYVSYLAKIKSFPMNSLQHLMSHVVSYAEGINFNRLYVKYFNSDHKVWERIYRTHIQRYSVATEESIPASKKSSFKDYWIVYQDLRIYKEPITIRGYSLKEQYRTFRSSLQRN